MSAKSKQLNTKPGARERAIRDCMKIVDERRLELQKRGKKKGETHLTDEYRFAADEMLELLDKFRALSKSQ